MKEFPKGLDGLFSQRKGSEIERKTGGKSWNFDKCSNHGKTKKAPMKKRKK